MIEIDPEISLRQFAEAFLLGALPNNPCKVWDYGPVVSLVLFRVAPFQVEQFIVKPGGSFPDEHRHPNVDTYEIPLFGMEILHVNGQPAQAFEEIAGMKALHIGSDDWHGAVETAEGAAFFSIQKWAPGVEPTSVGIDWIGKPPSPEHAARLVEAGVLSEHDVD